MNILHKLSLQYSNNEISREEFCRQRQIIFEQALSGKLTEQTRVLTKFSKAFDEITQKVSNQASLSDKKNASRERRLRVRWFLYLVSFLVALSIAYQFRSEISHALYEVSSNTKSN